MPKTITITLTDAQVKYLEHDLLDIDQWVKDAVAGRVNYSAKRLADEARSVLMNDPAVETIPAKPAPLITAYMARPDYRDRKKRDEDEEAERIKRDKK